MHDHTHSESHVQTCYFLNYCMYMYMYTTRVSVYLRGTCCYHSALLVHTDAGDVMLVGINQNLSSCFLW